MRRFGPAPGSAFGEFLDPVGKEGRSGLFVNQLAHDDHRAWPIRDEVPA